jgi:apolipoprotein D and lipocalin family protein
MKYLVIFIIISILLIALACCAPKKNTAPLNAVPFVDLAKYTGRWFEIARYPHRFEKGCSAVTADYSLQEDGTIEVLNQCRREEESNRIKKAKGKAKVVDTQSNAKLKVSFFWPFYGDYWILKLDPDYQYAIVGTPSRKYVWILSRTPIIPEKLLEELIEDIRFFGYDPDLLIMTKQLQT